MVVVVYTFLHLLVFIYIIYEPILSFIKINNGYGDLLLVIIIFISYWFLFSRPANATTGFERLHGIE